MRVRGGVVGARHLCQEYSRRTTDTNTCTNNDSAEERQTCHSLYTKPTVTCVSRAQRVDFSSQLGGVAVHSPQLVAQVVPVLSKRLFCLSRLRRLV